MTPPDRPDVELLATWDAGLPDVDRADRALAAAATDPAAGAVLAALARTRAELAELGALDAPEVPPELAERWATALARLAPTQPDPNPQHAPTAQPPTAGLRAAGLRAVAHPGPARRAHRAGCPKPNRGARAARQPLGRPRPALLAAAIVLVAGVFGAAPGDPPGRIDLAATARSALGHTDLGPLADPARRAGCLRAVGAGTDHRIDAAAPLLGGRQVVLDGRPGVLLVFPAGRLGEFRVAVVDPGCGPAGGTLLDSTTIGAR